MSSSSGSSDFQGWPALTKAEYRGQALQLDELHEGLYLIEDAFTVEECRCMIEAAAPKVVSTNPRNLPPRKNHAFRNNERYLVRRFVRETIAQSCDARAD